ncbi:hypothetical protein DL546_003798 [Coniochaeta pulveracea]|uniref:Uncharacterized protein n=1 Tax=Coniochaeta pulveracea TaxID=177199 RepID=A0A420XZ17_9PEZI|nr:hypothetical protein DL546_003798 [Coniochaeta pulveracea]
MLTATYGAKRTTSNATVMTDTAKSPLSHWVEPGKMFTVSVGSPTPRNPFRSKQEHQRSADNSTHFRATRLQAQSSSQHGAIHDGHRPRDRTVMAGILEH